MRTTLTLALVSQMKIFMFLTSVRYT